MEPDETHEAAAPDRRRRTLGLLLAPIIGLTALAYVGDILYADLANRNPYLLIALNTRKRYLALVVPNTDVIPYFIVGVTRQVLSDPLFYLLGRWYGDGGVRWIERKLGEGGGMIRAVERGFAKASYPMVALVPNLLVCMLAGAQKMRPSVFLSLNIGGTIAMMAVIRVFGDIFSAPLEAVLGFFGRYRWQLVAVSALLVGYQIIRDRRRGTSDLESISKLESELEQATAETESEAEAE